MDALPRDEQWAVWDETGRNFWQKFDNDNHIHDAKSEAHYQMQASSIKGELYELTNKRTQLTHSQGRLSKELAQVEEELARVVQACDDKVTVLHTLEQDCRRCEREKLERRSQIATTMDKFFREKQGKDPNAPTRRDRQHFHDIVNNIPQRMIPNREAVHAEALQQANEVARSTQALPSKKAQTSVSKSKPGNVLVNVTNSDGHVIGPVEKIEPWNQWVEAIQDVPIRRQVKIRRGRKFTQDHLATIYDRSEAKGVKWVACMIQATGQIQQQRCSSCDKNQGAFDDCIILGGPLFQKCGNCEWNRQGCHMPTKTNTSSSMHCPGDSTITERSEMLVFRAPPPPPPPLPPPPPPPLPTGQGQNLSLIRSYASHEPKGGPEPVRLPTPNEYGFLSHRQQHNQQQKYPVSSVLTPANAHSRPLSRDIPTPSIQSVENSPQPMPQAEITRSNLALRHDGTAYIYPECVEGVPLIKIDQRHPYWDPRWPSIQSIIKPQLDMWKIKYNEAIQRKAKGEGGSAKFQTGRQVNRGVKILEFLEQGDISPYQLLSKKYTHTGKGTITAYDTLFRMCETLGELAKFRLDISPVEWLRHRLHEIILEEGANFNYSKTMHDFYHDPKLAALRDRNGFKSIGRPSGFKAGQGGGRGTSGTPTSVKKRKSMHSQTDTPRATPSASHSPLIPPQEEYIPSPVPSSSITHNTADPAHAIPKRLKPLSPVSAPPSDEFYTDDVSDTDSWSGAPLQKLDWRVYQVKTRLFTSQTEVTQYWHWKEDKRVFEHQVLKDTKPVTWGLLRAPIDFDIPLDDIAQVDWNMDALQVHFVMSQFGSSRCTQDGKPRGDVMATFKRATTMRRFLSYCRQRRLKLTSITADEIEKRWAAMPSYKLPVIDDEASPALRE
ncbi:hypothetical protein EsHS_00001968 [Epichloe bromicola]